MILARFLSNGTLDLTYAVEGVATADFGIGNNRSDSSPGFALIQQADGKLVAVGPTQVGTLSAARFDDGATFPGIIGLINTNQTVAEATATVVYTVRRTGGSDGSVSVHYATAAGQALTGSDFQDASDTLSWDDGDTSDRFITINLIDDAEVEGDENFSLTLSEPTGGAALAASQAVTNIANDDLASGDGDGDGGGGGGGGGGGAFSAWSLVFLCGFFFAGNVQRRRTSPRLPPLSRLACKARAPGDPELDSGPDHQGVIWPLGRFARRRAHAARRRRVLADQLLLDLVTQLQKVAAAQQPIVGVPGLAGAMLSAHLWRHALPDVGRAWLGDGKKGRALDRQALLPAGCLVRRGRRHPRPRLRARLPRRNLALSRFS